MKQAVQWTCVLVCAAFIGWTHSHTDEIPVVLGFVLILSAILGGVFPRQPWITGFLMGAPPFIVETLVHISLIHAPYPPSAGIPWPALLGFVPGMGGAFFGSAIRHLGKQANPSG